MDLKLYRVTLVGFGGYSSELSYKTSYVVADDAESAYGIVRRHLDGKDYGFRWEREMKQVELLAEDMDTTRLKTRLFLPDSIEEDKGCEIETDKKQMRPRDYLRFPYSRLLNADEETGGFTAKIVEFPGCFSEGDTIEEAARNIEIAAESWLEAVIERGQPVPEPFDDND